MTGGEFYFNTPQSVKLRRLQLIPPAWELVTEPSLCWDTRLCGSVTVLTQEVEGGK